MPDLGVPDFAKAKNPFKGIKKAPSNKKSEVLDSVTRNSREKFFVDKKTHNKMNKDSFLKLLSHQLQNQDPMNPMDQNKFAADLAQFAQLEQMANMNSKMGKLGENAPTENKSIVANFLGKRVYTQSKQVDYDGKPVSFNFDMQETAKKAIIRILDKKGQTVSEMEMGQIQKGINYANWDGMRLDGYPATPGEYTVDIKYLNDSGQLANLPTGTDGIIQSVDFVSGAPVFTLDNGKKISLKEVYRFELAEAKKAPPKAMGQKIANQYGKNQVGMKN